MCCVGVFFPLPPSLSLSPLMGLGHFLSFFPRLTLVTGIELVVPCKDKVRERKKVGRERGKEDEERMRLFCVDLLSCTVDQFSL